LGASTKTTEYRVENVREVLFLRFGNMTYGQYRRTCVVHGTKPLAKQAVEDISGFLWKACGNLGKRLNKENLDECVKRGNIVLVADEGWTKREWTSKQ
jgi:hypothetical protein